MDYIIKSTGGTEKPTIGVLKEGCTQMIFADTAKAVIIRTGGYLTDCLYSKCKKQPIFR